MEGQGKEKLTFQTLKVIFMQHTENSYRISFRNLSSISPEISLMLRTIVSNILRNFDANGLLRLDTFFIEMLEEP